MHWPSSPLAQTGILLTLAGLCALISNGTANPSRRLGWRDRPAAAVTSSITAALPAPTPRPMADPLPVQPEPKATATQKPTVPPAAPANPARFAADPAQPIREISADEAWVLYQAKSPFLDARRSSEYREGHIAGAWNVSVWEAAVAAQITEFEAAAKPGSSTPLVLYCSGGDCEDSHLLASRLTPLGYRNLFVYMAGYPDWVQHGRPTGKGEGR